MKNIGYAFATKMLVDSKRKVRFMYREEGEDNDSGWRFFCGEEDQDYLDNPDNSAIYDVHDILDIDKSILPYLQSAAGTAFERENDNETFKVITNFSLDVKE